MQAPGSRGSQRAQGLERYVIIYADLVFIFPVPASTATLTRTTHDPDFLRTSDNAHVD